MRRAGITAALMLVAACRSAAPATQVTVIVEADPLVRAETARLEYVVLGGVADAVQLAVREERTLDPIDFPFDVTIAPLEGDTTRLFELEATALDRADRIVARVRVRSGYQPGASRTIRLHMDDRCRGVVCGARQTCVGGACVDDGDPSDGGVDVPDAGMPGPCASDAECDDGVFCNGAETCVGDACVPGERPDCTDRFACTEDRCEVGGCVHVGVDAECTLGPGGRCDATDGCQYDVCDTTTCVAGPCETVRCDGTTCVRTPTCAAGETCCGTACVASGCDDANPCTADACDAGLSVCTHLPRLFTCSDGDACTSGDECRAGACQPGGPVSCDDGNACTDDSCSPAIGCQNVDSASRCDDGNACTRGDVCGGGACIPGMTTTCDDGIPCTLDACAGGSCSSVPDSALCPPGATCVVGSGCQFAATCDPVACAASAPPCVTGTCSGSTCTYSGGCVAPQTCCGGACMNCDDSNPCTMDSCSGSSCAHAPIGGPCSDGDACTTGDACTGGACRGTPTSCGDGNPCTSDSCNPTTGACAFAPAPPGTTCNDGNACTTGDTCTGSSCGATGTLACDDSNVCTSDACSPSSGCVFTPRADGAQCGEPTDCTELYCSSGACLVRFLCTGMQMCCPGRGCISRFDPCE